MAIRTILGVTRDLGDLRPKLSKIESILGRVRDGTKDNTERVSTLSEEIAPIEDIEGKMRAHMRGYRSRKETQKRRKLKKKKSNPAASAGSSAKRWALAKTRN